MREMNDKEYAECLDKLIADMKSSYSIYDRWNAEDIESVTRNEARRR